MENISFGAGAIIIKDGKLLAVKHKDYPHYYTVGGRIEFNETSEEAVIREVFEETGYKLEIERLAIIQERFIILSINKEKHHEFVFFYIMKNCGDINITDNTVTDQPTKTLHWIPINDLEQTNIVPPILKTKNKTLNNNTGIEHIISKD